MYNVDLLAAAGVDAAAHAQRAARRLPTARARYRRRRPHRSLGVLGDAQDDLARALLRFLSAVSRQLRRPNARRRRKGRLRERRGGGGARGAAARIRGRAAAALELRARTRSVHGRNGRDEDHRALVPEGAERAQDPRPALRRHAGAGGRRHRSGQSLRVRRPAQHRDLLHDAAPRRRGALRRVPHLAGRRSSADRGGEPAAVPARASPPIRDSRRRWSAGRRWRPTPRTSSARATSISIPTWSRSSTSSRKRTRRRRSTASSRCAQALATGGGRSEEDRECALSSGPGRCWRRRTPCSCSLFAAYPIVFALVLVFLQWDLVTAPSFAGLDNVRLLANDGRFWRAVGNTFVFLGIHVPLQIVTALALALALNRPLVLRAFLAGGVLPARRDLRRGRRDSLEYSLRHRRRPDQQAARASRIGAGAVAHRSADGDARDRGDGDVEERRLLRDHLSGGASVHPTQLPGGDRDRRRDPPGSASGT